MGLDWTRRWDLSPIPQALRLGSSVPSGGRALLSQTNFPGKLGDGMKDSYWCVFGGGAGWRGECY